MKRFLTFVGFLAVFPFFLSRRSRVVRSAWINVPAADLFPLLNDLKCWPLWTEWSRKGGLKARYEGAESGEGAVQHWTASCTEGTLRVIAAVPNQSLSYSLEMNGGDCRLEGVLRLEPEGRTGTRLTWACWWVGSANPYARYFDLAMRWWIIRDFEAGLRNLKALAEARRLEGV